MAPNQPIIRGIQAVGGVQVTYRYNSTAGLEIPKNWAFGSKVTGYLAEVGANTGVPIAGFKLNQEFLRANPQLAQSFTTPLLGGGAVSLTNNNTSGTLSLSVTSCSTPVVDESSPDKDSQAAAGNESKTTPIGQMVGGSGSAIGVVDDGGYYDLAMIAQIQALQPGGDSWGASIGIVYSFAGKTVGLYFQGCTVASVDPLALAGNDLPDYNVTFNYLTWFSKYYGTKAATLVF